MLDLRTRATEVVDHLSVIAGVVGPASGAREAQRSVHRMLGQERPQGWDGQLRGRPTFMLGYERAWPGLVSSGFAGRRIDASARAGASIGTPLTYASVGAVLRYGVNLPFDLPATHLSLGPPRDGFRGTPDSGWYVWAGFDAHAVGYNTLIQGATFAGGPHVSREPFGTDTQGGVVLAWPRKRLGFTLVQRSREFKGQHGDDRYGQLTYSWAY
jgi:hypothetical protein